MLNHVRTLLLNAGPDGYSASRDPGEEYVPAYRPRQLSGLVVTAHQFLFGNRSDRLFLNFRLAQLLNWLHASPLEPQLYTQDTRITYQPFAATPLDWCASDVLPTGWRLARPAIADAGHGWTTFGFRVVRVDNDLQVQQLQPGRYTQVVPLIFEADWSQPVLLGDSQAQLQIAEGSASSWQGTLRARPTEDLGQLLTAWHSLFGEALADTVLSSRPELRERYRGEPLATTQYAALLLGLAYHLESLPPRV